MKLIAALTTLLVGFSCTTASTSGDGSCVRDDVVIWQNVLEHEVTRLARADQVLILYESTALPRRHEAGDIAKYFRNDAGRALATRNASVTNLSAVPRVDRVRFVSQREVDAVFEKRSRTNEEEWKMFYAAFPNAAGMVNVSLPGYSADGATVLVYVEWQGGPLAAEGSVYRLTCRNGRWRVARRESQWVS